MRQQTKRRITPGNTTLHLGDVSDLFNIKPNTLRQHIRRGTMPEPTVRRDPELGWPAADIYRWAYETGRLPSDAIPFRYLRTLIADGTLPGPSVPRIHQVIARAHAEQGHGPGIAVRYGNLTNANLGFTLYYPDAYGRINLDPSQADIAVTVTGHYSLRGFFVDVHQAHPEYDYDVDTEFYTQDVALLVQEPIPYWPMELRTVVGGVDRRTGHIISLDDVTAEPSDWLTARSLATAAFADDNRHSNQATLATALRADVAHDYRTAAEHTQHFLDEYVAEHQATSWTLTDPHRHLFVAATPAPPDEETRDAEAARNRLPELLWHTPVGDTATARQVAAGFVNAQEQRVFSSADATEAQRAFRSALVAVPADEATLVHLAFSHPKFGRSPDAAGAPRDYWRDPHSGALATVFRAVEGEPEYVRYAMPQEYPETPGTAAFDFEDAHQPFIRAIDGGALPFPLDPESGYALGYSGSGPQAVRAMSAKLLGLDRRTAVTPRWPFFREGYPTRVSAEEMRSLYEQGEQ